jgi:hypothetical protein
MVKKNKVKPIHRDTEVKETYVLPTPAIAADTVSFDQWWMMIARKITLRPHLKEIIWADFNARGLSKNETEKKYDDTLKVFGYTW